MYQQGKMDRSPTKGIIMFNKAFWADAAERAIKTAAQFMLGVFVVADQVTSAWEMDWVDVAGIGLTGAAFSLLTSVASAGIGRRGSASVLPAPPAPDA